MFFLPEHNCVPQKEFMDGRQNSQLWKKSVNVTAPFNYIKQDSVSNETENTASINETEQRIVDYISQNSGITIKELVSASGYSDGYIRKILTSLKEKKIIERHGGNRYGKWIVVKR